MKYCTEETKKSECTFEKPKHPYLGCRVIVRTFSAGVHAGTLNYADGNECELIDALRLWNWSEGGLSLHAIATNGVVKARINETSKVYLTEAIEYIPFTKKCEDSFVKWIEDKK